MAIDRRSALRLLLGGSCAAPLISACSGVTRGDLAADGESDSTILPGPLQDMLYYASLAPSRMNAQPWTITMRSISSLGIAIDPARTLPITDPQARQTTLAIGAFLENFDIAGAHHGVYIDYEAANGAEAGGVLLEAVLSEASPSPQALDRIRLRRTIRSPHERRVLAPADVRDLANALAGSLAWHPRQTPEGRLLADAMLTAQQARAARDDVRRENAKWLRWSDDAVRDARDGITTEAMELSWLGSWYARNFMSNDDALTLDYQQRQEALLREQIENCAGWLIVMAPDDETANLLETGRRLQRMLLAARERNIAVHPMSQVTEDGAFREQLAGALSAGARVQLVLRIGYVNRYPDPVSPRRPTSWFASTASPAVPGIGSSTDGAPAARQRPRLAP